MVRFNKVLYSWPSFNGLNVKLKVNIASGYDEPTIANEKVSGKGELERYLAND